MKAIRVLIVDDSSVVRRLIEQALSADPEVEVCGRARNGQEALELARSLQPDLLTLDVEMPVMDGLTALKELRREWPRLPVIMFSTLTLRGGTATIEALSHGANDYVTKPEKVADPQEAVRVVRGELLPRIKQLCASRRSSRNPASAPPAPVPRRVATRSNAPVRLLVIGVSTGGPEALMRLFSALPGDLPVPVAIVQHMPPMFTGILAERLNSKVAMTVREAKEGEVLLPGEALIAPGNRHMELQEAKGRLQIRLTDDPPENSCRPAVDVLFRSAARTVGGGCLALMLTGMGQDGARGAETLVREGGRLLAQDEESSVVWGMPGAVVQAGLASEVLPLDAIAARVTDLVSTRLSLSI